MEYRLNKGVGQDVEFCGLKAQYLYLFAGGLLAVFLVFVILYMAGVNRLFCIAPRFPKEKVLLSSTSTPSPICKELFSLLK